MSIIANVGIMSLVRTSLSKPEMLSNQKHSQMEIRGEHLIISTYFKGHCTDGGLFISIRGSQGEIMFYLVKYPTLRIYKNIIIS